jgi:uncharacterized lipoprotein YddW (UPF0748 family)
VKDVRAAGGGDIIISLSPGPHPWALENYLVDWPAWSRWTDNPTWDEYVPQIYRMDFQQFRQELEEQVKAAADSKSKLIAGIRLVGQGPDLPREDIERCVQACRQAGIAGHSWWFSRGVLEVYPDEIARIYDVGRKGHVPHPVRSRN